MPPVPELKTHLMGDVEPSGKELAAMQKANYLLHARDGKITKIPA